MSVLKFPRIYVNGHMFWNPPTANNNDIFPYYDAVKMQLNWPFLASFGINPANAATKLMPWVIAPLAQNQVPDYVLQVPTNGAASNYPIIPAEWDLFGDNACGTVNYQQTQSSVVGGELQANSYISKDTLVNKSYQLVGNPFGGSNPAPARFVDVSPWQNTFTALFFDKLVLGDETCGITLNREYRMLDRFLNFNWGAFGGLSYVTTTWQSCFPTENLQWVISDSVLLQNLQQQIQQQNAQGLMFRFSTYLTFYDKNGIFNNYPPINTHFKDSASLAKVQAMYQQGLDNTADIFFNPAYSRTAGTLGLWFANEFPTAPGGRRLAPAQPVPVWKTNAGDTSPPSMTLGVIAAEANGNTLSLDLANTFPFYPVDKTADIPVAAKFNAGNYLLGIRSQGQFTPLASLDYDQYNQAAFDLRSGILDFPLTANAQQQLQTGTLELQLQGAQPVTAAVEQVWTAEVVQSAGFIDVGDTQTLTIMVQYQGLPAPAGTVLWVAEYANPFMITTSNYYLAFTNDANFTLFYNNQQDPSQNSANLPQFTNMPLQESLRMAGSGRRLSAIAPATQAATVPVLYQDYLQTPTALTLQPCLKFANSIGVNGTLADPLGSTVQYQLVPIQTDANGVANLKVTAVAPGFPTLRFFVQQGNQQPTIPFSFNFTEAYTDFLAPLRVLPQEPELEQQFINYWNSIYTETNASTLIWENFIFPNILQPFYYLYPIMNKYMPLNSLARIEGAIDQLIVLISKEYQEESTLAMPITRDLPQSRRAVLSVWATQLVKRNYPPIPLSASSFAS